MTVNLKSVERIARLPKSKKQIHIFDIDDCICKGHFPN